MVDISQLSQNELVQEIAKYEQSIDILNEGLKIAGGFPNDQRMPIGIWGGTWGNDYYSYYVVGSPDQHNVGGENIAEAIREQLAPILTELKTELTNRTFFHSQEGGTGTIDIGQQPIVVTPPVVTPPVVTPPVVTPPVVTPPQIDDSISTNMVTQQVINFNIVNGRAVGSIKFVATNNFNPYYYNKEIINLVQFKTPNGVTLLVKENRLRFTQTERDEVINYNESIQENTRITVESFVWEWIDKPAGAFSNKYEIKISEKEPPKPVSSGFMGAGIAGAIAGLVLLGFIVDSKVGK